MADDDVCNMTKLALGIGSGNSLPIPDQEKNKRVLSLDLSFSVGQDEGQSSGNSNDGEFRKKLRLSKEQSIVLEDSFKEHTTLNIAQKNELATILNLRPRQVEVWFQNRRARTKLKQTEMDCELLKKHCRNLNEENLKLKKEIQDLKAFKNGERAALFDQLANSVEISVCPSCGKIDRAKGISEGNHERAAASAASASGSGSGSKYKQSGLRIRG